MPVATPITQPYYKKNCGWPVRRVVGSWELLNLALRYEAGVRHFVRTPMGSLWRDIHYGMEIHRLRVQGMVPEEERPILYEQAQRGFRRYLPDLAFQELSVIADQENERRGVVVVWIIRGANKKVHGDLANPRKTEVLV